MAQTGGRGGAQPQHICWHHLMQREPSRASLPAPSPPSVLRPWLRPLLQLAAENREQFPSPVPPRGLAGCPPAALRGEVPKSSPLLREACGEPDPYPRHTETSRPCRSSEKCRHGWRTGARLCSVCVQRQGETWLSRRELQRAGCSAAEVKLKLIERILLEVCARIVAQELCC